MVSSGDADRRWSFCVCADDEDGVGALMVGRSGLALDEVLAESAAVVRELVRDGAARVQVDIDRD